MARRTAPSSSVQSVERALRLLELLADEPRGIALTLAAERLDLNVATTHRLLSTLMANGYVLQSQETDRYFLSADSVLVPRTPGCSSPGAGRQREPLRVQAPGGHGRNAVNG